MLWSTSSFSEPLAFDHQLSLHMLRFSTMSCSALPLCPTQANAETQFWSALLSAKSGPEHDDPYHSCTRACFRPFGHPDQIRSHLQVGVWGDQHNPSQSTPVPQGRRIGTRIGPGRGRRPSLWQQL